MSPEKALEKAKIGLMFHQCAFINTVVFSMHHIFSNEIPTACTNGKTVTYNPEFFMGLTKQQRLSLLVHEAWHPALLQISRGKGKDPEIYNKAADYVVNLLVKKAGFVALPAEIWLYNEAYIGLSTEQVYDILVKDPTMYPPLLVQDIISIDAPDKAAEFEQGMETTLLQAAAQEQHNNRIPSEIGVTTLRTTNVLLTPVVPWIDVLTQYLTEYTNSDYSWKRPNKRYMPEYFLPSLYSQSILDLTIAIDTSGSMSKGDLQSILGEIEYIRDTVKPRKITLIDCDYKIHNIWEVLPDTELLDLPFKGGGGSNCHPVFDYCGKHPTNLLIYFTDLYFRKQFEESVDFPVLWIVYDNPDAVVKIGKTITYTKES